MNSDLASLELGRHPAKCWHDNRHSVIKFIGGLISIPVRGSPTYQATYDLSGAHDERGLSYDIVYTHTQYCVN